MQDTQFADPQGLNDSETYSTAADVARMVRAALAYPFLAETLTRSQIEIPTLEGTSYHVTNTNQLLSVIPGVLIGKTGNTSGALGTMALAVQTEGVGNGMISVVLGSVDRFGETKNLIDWGKRTHKWTP